MAKKYLNETINILVKNDGKTDTYSIYPKTAPSQVNEFNNTVNDLIDQKIAAIPEASSDMRGFVYIGNNITNNSGTISITGENINSALGYTPVDTQYVQNIVMGDSSSESTSHIIPMTLSEVTSALNNDYNFANTMNNYLTDLDERLKGQNEQYKNPSNNQIWFDVNERTIKIYNSKTKLWESFEISSVQEPENPIENQTWLDVNTRSIKIYKNGKWENFEITSIDEPINPVNNQIWFNINERAIKIYNSKTNQWENFEVSSIDEPSNPINNQIWFDVNERSVKIYNAETKLWESFETASIDEPINPVNNQIWTDVNDKSIKIYNSETNEWATFVAKPVKVSITIPTTNWQYDANDESDYKYYYSIQQEGLKENDMVEIFYARESISTVLEAGVCPSDNQTLSNEFRIYAAAIPTEPIIATYVIWKG